MDLRTIFHVPWTDGLIVGLGLLVLLVFRNTTHKVRLGYVAFGTTVVLLCAIAFREYTEGDTIACWSFALLAVALAFFTKPLAWRVMNLHKNRH